MLLDPNSTARLFPRATTYPVPESGLHDRVRDPCASLSLAPPATERLLQATWYDPRLRPDPLTASNGETVVVESPGAWNVGAGPDFLGALIRIGPDRRRIHGDVEVHVRPSEWTAHGHAGDSRYRNVRFHVTFFSAPPPSAPLPTGTVHIALRDRLAAEPGFSFESVDPAAYPYAVRRSPCPCAAELDSWDPGARGRLLEAAGEERLRRKAARFRARAEDQGPEQALYEELMAALGYRHNKTPFRRLAVSVPWHAVRDESAGSSRTAFALLAGVAGLLPATPRPDWDEATRQELRATWAAWWKLRRRWARFCFPKSAWRLSGVRPVNHPVRRLQAAACWMTRPTPIHEALIDSVRPSPTPFATILAWLDAPAEGYWRQRLTWGGKAHPTPMALVGKSRAAAVLINGVIPYLAVSGARVPPAWLDALPAESGNELIRRAAHALFGPDTSPTLFRTGLRRQGLLQIFHDYCLPDRTACAGCPLPGYLRRHRSVF